MTSSPCSAGERRSRGVLQRPAGWIALLATVPLAFTTVTLLGQPAGGREAMAVLRAPVCPAYKNLCVNADKSGVFDMQTGVAELEGDVRGYLESQEMTFHSELLRAFRNADGDWKRLLLSNNVSMSQPGRKVTAEHGVVEEETALFYGNARMVDGAAVSESDELYLEHEVERATLRGTPQNPVRMEYTAAPKEDAAAQVTAAGAGAAEVPAKPAKARAQKAVVEEQSRQVTLTGQVHVDLPDRDIQLDAESVVLQFGEDNSVTAFQARGEVVIVQPGRRLTADSARSQNRMQTILLQGRAKAQQQGQFELNSDRMEVFTDPKKGQVRSEDRQRPINLSLDLAAGKPYKLESAKLQTLVDKGVPPDTVRKLNPVLGRPYSSQDGFRKAVNELLTQEESQRFLSIIIEQAR